MPLRSVLPKGADVQRIAADLVDDSVSAPEKFVPKLQEVVAAADSKGIDLKIVFLEQFSDVYTMNRDLATELSEFHEGTILVRSFNANGTYSDTYSRGLLEAGELAMNSGELVEDTTAFVDALSEPLPVEAPLIAATVVMFSVCVAALGKAFLTLTRR